MSRVFPPSQRLLQFFYKTPLCLQNMDILYVEDAESDAIVNTMSDVPRHISSNLSTYSSIETTDLGGIFIPAVIYKAPIVGTNAAEHFAAALFRSMVFEHGVNTRFMTQLLDLHANKPYYFAGGKEKKGWVSHQQHVTILHTGTEVVNVKTVMTVIPPISTYGIKRLSYRNQLVVPYETVDRDSFRQDINEFINFQNIMSALTGPKQLSQTTRGELVKLIRPKILNGSNMVWNRIRDAIRESTHCSTDDEVNAIAQEIVELYWWPSMIQNSQNKLSHRLGHMANYTTSLNTGVLVLNKLVDSDIPTTMKKMEKLNETLQTEKDITAIKETLKTNDIVVNELLEALDIIDAVKGHLTTFDPIPRGIIAVAQTHYVSPGDRVELSLM